MYKHLLFVTCFCISIIGKAQSFEIESFLKQNSTSVHTFLKTRGFNLKSQTNGDAIFKQTFFYQSSDMLEEVSLSEVTSTGQIAVNYKTSNNNYINRMKGGLRNLGFKYFVTSYSKEQKTFIEEYKLNGITINYILDADFNYLFQIRFLNK